METIKNAVKEIGLTKDGSRDKEFRERLIHVIKAHAKVSDKVIKSIRVSYDSCGFVSGYAFEYENKHQ